MIISNNNYLRNCLAVTTILIGLVCTNSSYGRTNLWSERNPNAAPMAQVPNFRVLADKVIPAVVSIRTEQHHNKPKRKMRGHHNDPFEYFHRFFGIPNLPQGPNQPRHRNQGIGTGFVIGENGLILTNFHVVENADLIEVSFATNDGTTNTIKATILGTAPEYDVALIKTETNAKSPIVHLGNSAKMQIGDWVMAVGNPFGLSHSVSVGIISAKERRDINPSGRQGLYNFLQTDASINPGNSGGPLINMRGEVIGINTAINAAGSGIGFAIPINMVKEILPDLNKKGKYTRSWIGVRIQPLTKDLAHSYNLDKAHGALISEVIPDSPASLAGLKEGDIILKFDNKTLRSASDLPLYASLAGVGKNINLEILRDGKILPAKIILGSFPNEPGAVLADNSTKNPGGLGITITNLTENTRRQLQLQANQQGALIKDIQVGSPAHRAGLRPGDLILQINEQILTNAQTFIKYIRAMKKDDIIRMKILRRNGRMFLALRKP